jgi:hypothetical protein
MNELAKEVLRVGSYRDLKAREIEARVAAENAQISDNELLKIIAQNQVDIAERLHYIRQLLKFICLAIIIAGSSVIVPELMSFF